MIGVNCGPNMASLVSGLPLHGSQIRTMRLVALHPEPLPAHGKPLFPRGPDRRADASIVIGVADGEPVLSRWHTTRERLEQVHCFCERFI